MNITVFTRSRELGRALTEGPVSTLADRVERFEIGPLQRVPGAVDSFWQLAVDIGAVSAPIGIACNLIASWLYDAYGRWRDKPTAVQAVPEAVTVKLVIRTDAMAVDVQLRVDDRETMAAELERVLGHDHPQP
jgi:hypothetical protein